MLQLISETLQNYLRFNVHGLLYLMAGTATLSTGLFVITRDPKSKTHQSFSLFTLSSSIWIMCFGMIILVRDIQNAPFWLSLSYVLGISFIPVFTYLFSVYLTEKKPNKPFIYLCFLWATLISIPMIFFTKNIAGIVDYSWGRYGLWHKSFYGNLHVSLLVIPFFIIAGRAFINFYWGWKKSRDAKRRIQIRNVFLAFIVAYTGGVDFLTSTGFDIYPFGFISLTASILLVGYTIVKHQFLNITIVLKKVTLIFLIYALLLLTLFPLSVPLIKHFLSQDLNPLGVIFSLSLLMGLVLSLGPILYAYLIRNNYWLQSQMSMGLTHELKSPLGAIQSALDILKDNLKNPHKTREYIKLIQTNATRLEGSVSDLLNLSKIQHGEITLNKQLFNLSELIKEIAYSYKPLLQKKHLHLDTAIQHQIHYHGDKDKISQAISNLLSNAVKFSEKGTLIIHLSKTEKEKVILFSVKDEGRGIPKKELTRIFERFYQSERGTKGTGLGLSIAKGWVEAHGGRIWAELGGEGKGTKITFTLPI